MGLHIHKTFLIYPKSIYKFCHFYDIIIIPKFSYHFFNQINLNIDFI